MRFIASATLEEANMRLHDYAVRKNHADRLLRWEKLSQRKRDAIGWARFR